MCNRDNINFNVLVNQQQRILSKSVSYFLGDASGQSFKGMQLYFLKVVTNSVAQNAHHHPQHLFDVFLRPHSGGLYSCHTTDNSPLAAEHVI
jgi:hypothetical protein